ncbi:hypothetical protein K1T71_000487 [Dendrolimus kikuchii]|uniref:Uncharacterized protein n=1 Tax=Dendrolimus kikuchii TaxID=765133 RepID=A0ACC1DJB8_9NEOP|nr:hypothetical protein K1T71_000487 [Dendrolimus kikuchii]
MAASLSDISKHLTDEIIEKAFEFHTNDKSKFIKVARAAPAGEGLLGAVYRVTVTGQKNTASFIVKGLVGDTLLRKSLGCAKYFKREVFFYSQILPSLLEFEKELGAEHSIQNHVPICYTCVLDGENDFIILEDLLESNCVVLSVNPTRHQRDVSLSVIAHIHAVSMALRIKNPKDFARIANAIPEIYYNEDNREWYSGYLQNAIEINKTIINEYEDSKSIYYKKFYEIVDNDVYSQFIELLNPSVENSVLNHGDAWCLNFLCSEDRSVAIDFQLIRCASPATDLAYFIILCGNHCKVKEDFFEAVDIYYKSFEFYIQDLGLNANEVFPKENLLSDLKNFGKFGLLASLTSIPLLASKRCDVLESFKDKYSKMEQIPLEDLWRLSPINDEEQKMRVVNAVRVTVDVGLI